jgi:phosphohistidine swiveling domain-containing protein
MIVALGMSNAMTVTEYLRRLSGGPFDTALVGSKAGVLSRLLVAGFLVPDGFVLTTAALERALEYAGFDARSTPTPEAVQSMEICPEVDAALGELVTEMGQTPLAVRSSAVDEDLAGRSYAGQYTSVLHVVGERELRQAVRDCWASALSGLVRSYAGETAASGRIAVLVQPMVDADAAGVAFSADPVTGNRARAHVSAVPGVGDRLAGGSATPDEWSVTDEPAHESGTGEAITAEQAKRIADLARQVAEHQGGPQDIEWALSSQRLWLLQARPITALPDASDNGEIPDGFWRRSTNLARPLSPMHRSLVLPILNDTVPRMFDYAMVSGVRFQTIGGWQYSSFQPLPQERIPERIRRIVSADAADEPMATVRRWYDEWQPELDRRIRALQDIELSGMSDAALIEHFDALRDFCAETGELHFQLVGAQGFLLGELGTVCRDLLGWGVSPVLDLVAGQEGKTTEPGRRLTELAALAARNGALRQELAGGTTPERIAGIDAEFLAEFETYQRECGWRLTGADIDEPTPGERPGFVLDLIAQSLGEGATSAERAEPSRQYAAALAEAHSTLDDARRPAFDSAVERSRYAYPTRDDTKFYYDVALALLRYCLLEVGRRLAEAGRTPARDDVFLLEAGEARESLSSRESFTDRVVARAERLRREYANPGPAQYGKPPAPPASGGAASEPPPQVRAALDKAMWTFNVLRGGEQQDSEAYLSGTGASRGCYTGPVRVIRRESELDKVQLGDVLVCQETSAQWSMVFPYVGALVTDAGGMLSHPAIIAREYGIPAVLATGDATHRLADGVAVVVNGDLGTVELA